MKLSIIVPFKNRENHRIIFVPYLISYLQKQGIDFDINIIEAADEFRRGTLLNIGYDIVKNNCDYMCFHDIDMLPINADYSFNENVCQLATHAAQFEYKMPYKTYLGGVVLITPHIFRVINGYSNIFRIWGAEDDDLYNRLVHNKFEIDHRDCTFECLHHHRNYATSDIVTSNHRIMKQAKENSDFSSGLSNLKYLIQWQNRTECVRTYMVEYDISDI